MLGMVENVEAPGRQTRMIHTCSLLGVVPGIGLSGD